MKEPDASIDSFLTTSQHDLNAIWGWNHQLPPSHPFCMHEMISERAQQYPRKQAVDSWDGCLTYQELDEYSTLLAHSIMETHSQIPQFIPICFEKSKWTIVAVLTVMKLGAAMVLMDPTLPLARLQNMRDQVNASMILTSHSQQTFSSLIIPGGELIVVDAPEMEKLAQLSSASPKMFKDLPRVPSSALMYLIFTSGSTGTPKGVMISHKAYTSSAIARAAAVGYKEDTRVLDFASYAFDVSIDSMLLTLGNGGCLCIPSDEDRINDINGVMRRMRVTYAGITPSMARLLEHDVISQLTALGLGGEAASARDVNHWGQDTRIIIGYGPCECTIGCTINSDTATGREYISIGTGNGAAIWIVDPNDHELLLPVGAVGELLVEGPIVGQGYLNDPEKTAASFIKDPKWLVDGHGGYHGRHGVLYKTGDLGMYDPDGSGGIVFVGRKDTQVKLRGQRIELGEIESRLREVLPSDLEVVAEVIKPIISGAQPTLVAFIAKKDSVNSSAFELAELDEGVDAKLAAATTELAKVLPRYMVPAAFVPVNQLPLLISGKIDRKKIRELGVNVDLRQQLDGMDSDEADSHEMSEIEALFRDSWVQTLKVAVDKVGRQSNFFALGGDSIAAMKLVSACRNHGIIITVGDIFRNRTLSEMAASAILDADGTVGTTTGETTAFSLLGQPMESARQEAAQICHTAPTTVQDIYPCTPTQESLFTFAMKSETPYVAQRIAKIPSHIGSAEWKKAWDTMVADSPILRTRVVQLQDPGFQQVVLDEAIDWTHHNSLSGYLKTDKSKSMGIGERLSRYAIVDESGHRYMVWTIHHVVYDGFSEPLLLQKVRRALDGVSSCVSSHMKDFVRYVQNVEPQKLQSFWREELSGAIGPQFPKLPSRDYFPTPNGSASHTISLDKWANKSLSTVATLLRGAWAFVAAQHIGSDDVVFGETLMGRDISLTRVEEVCGPMVATVPIRVQVDADKSASQYLDDIQQSLVRLAPYQHAGMQNIRKVSDDAQFACETGTGIVIQPESGNPFEDLGFQQCDPVLEALHFNPYPLMIAFGLGDTRIRMSASFDQSLINTSQMQRILGQIEKVFLKMSQNPEVELRQISCLTESDLDGIWSRNHVAPMKLFSDGKALRAASSTARGTQYPPAIVPWICDPRNQSFLAPIGCMGELCFEGDVLEADSMESPAWLTAGASKHPGRSGKVQLTGDMVEMQQDGSMLYLGRKEAILSARRGLINLTQLQAHIDRDLPLFISGIAVLYPDTTSELESSGEAKSGAVVFVEEPPSAKEEAVELMWMNHQVYCDMSHDSKFETHICANITVILATAIRNLLRSIRTSLPSRLWPVAYIPLKQLPRDSNGQIDERCLQKIASGLPHHILEQLDKGLKEWWAKSPSLDEGLNPAEEILQAAWATILGRKSTEIESSDNFFRMGGDSVLAMKLVSHLRSEGHGLTVADIFKHMRLRDAARVLKVNSLSSENFSDTYEPFSLLDSPFDNTVAADVGRTKLASKQWQVVDILPVGGLQELDINATINPPKTSVQYTMLYFDTSVDKARLLDACVKWVKTHEILRTIFIEHESKFFQVIVEGDFGPVETKKCIQDTFESFVKQLCVADAESDFELGSPFLRLHHIENSDGRHCLAIGLSHAQYDGVSLPLLLEGLEKIYSSKTVERLIPFSRYVAYTKDTSFRNKAIEYWRNALQGSSLAILSKETRSPGGTGLFKTVAANIGSLPRDVTVANFLTAAWSVVLSRRLGTRDVTFGSVTSGRGNGLHQVERVAGPCYQFMPVRVSFAAHWTGADLMQTVQKQHAESTAYDFVGHSEIASTCTDWDTADYGIGVFDSVVHHQDWDDANEMPFGEGTCRLDICNPHGDAPCPLKVVSFMRNNELHFGIVGNEADSAIIQKLLSELVEVAHELASRPTQGIRTG